MSNLEILEHEFREYWETWKAIQLMDMPMSDRHLLHRIVLEEFDPNYPFVDWCGRCVVELLTFAFTQHEKTITV
jgi:hypothetical protein